MFSCECNTGFWKVDERICEDVDECMDEDKNNCDKNAHCLNNQGKLQTNHIYKLSKNRFEKKKYF